MMHYFGIAVFSGLGPSFIIYNQTNMFRELALLPSSGENAWIGNSPFCWIEQNKYFYLKKWAKPAPET
jgi:hypothetical protein